MTNEFLRKKWIEKGEKRESINEDGSTGSVAKGKGGYLGEAWADTVKDKYGEDQPRFKCPVCGSHEANTMCCGRGTGTQTCWNCGYERDV